MKYILIIFITLLISGSVSAASSSATVTSGTAQALATVNGSTIASSSQANQVDADSFAFGGGTATSQASNGTAKITSETSINTFSSTDTVNQPLPINQPSATNKTKKVIKPQAKQIAATQKTEESPSAVEAPKTEDKKIVVTPPADNKSSETVDTVNQRLNTLNQLVGSAIIILVIVLLNQLVLTYLLHKKYRQDITLKVPEGLS